MDRVVLSKMAANAALMRLPGAGNPHRLYQQIMDADVRRRLGHEREIVMHLDADERAALLSVLPDALHGEVA